MLLHLKVGGACETSRLARRDLPREERAAAPLSAAPPSTTTTTTVVPPQMRRTAMCTGNTKKRSFLPRPWPMGDEAHSPPNKGTRAAGRQLVCESALCRTYPEVRLRV